MNGVATHVTIAESSQTAEVRRIALSLAVRLEFDETKAGKVAIAVTEAATNLLKHGGGGEIVLSVVADGGVEVGLSVLALDKGPGIKSIGESLRDGNSTSGTSGNGLGAIARLSDAFDIFSQPGKGTALVAQFWKQPPSSANRFDVGGFSVPTEGEQACGDGWSFREKPTGITVFLSDGLGHGPQAEDASREAIQVFHRYSHLPPAELLEQVHRATRGTRGAAVAVASIDRAANLVRFSGIGNIVGALVAGGQTRHMVSMAGIIGHEARVFREFTYPWQTNAVMVMHSDGLGTRWDLGAYPGLLNKPCALMAGVLYRDFVRRRDDATCVVVRQSE